MNCDKHVTTTDDKTTILQIVNNALLLFYTMH